MRIWSLHPAYLDARGLVALWREALLAQAVLNGQTSGYLHHPQLLRFREHASPLGAIGDYLRAVHGEAANRGYRFAAEKICSPPSSSRLTVTRGQLEFEWNHLMRKLKARDPERRLRVASVRKPRPHPLFRVVRGNVASWERSETPAGKRRRDIAISRLLRFPGSVKRDPAIEAWMRERSGELGAIARRWFEVIRDCGDDVRELLHDGHPTACVRDAAFAYVNAFNAHVNVGFFRGAEIADPGHLLDGTGKFMRHVKLGPGRNVNAAALRKLIAAAYTDMKVRLETDIDP